MIGTFEDDGMGGRQSFMVMINTVDASWSYLIFMQRSARAMAVAFAWSLASILRASEDSFIDEAWIDQEA